MTNKNKKLVRFRGTLMAEPDGGHAVIVPTDIREQLGGPKRVRVRGTINGMPMRTNIAPYGGIPYIGVHKATVEKLKLRDGEDVEFEVEIDPEPRWYVLSLQFPQREKLNNVSWVSEYKIR